MRTRTPTSSEGGRDETEDGYGKQHHITDRDHVSLNSTINLVLTELYPSRPLTYGLCTSSHRNPECPLRKILPPGSSSRQATRTHTVLR